MSEVDYMAMSPGEMYMALGNDAEKWTEAFFQSHPDGKVDREVMFAWVCNMMMAAVDFQHGQPILCGDHAQFLLDQGDAA